MRYLNSFQSNLPPAAPDLTLAGGHDFALNEFLPDIFHMVLRTTVVGLFRDSLPIPADGMTPDEIVKAWGGRVPRAAIAESVQLARHSLLKDSGELRRPKEALAIA